MVVTDSWNEYFAWDEALSDVVYGDVAGVPVYLDIEEDLVWAAAEQIGVEREQAEQHFCNSVTETLVAAPVTPSREVGPRPHCH